MTVFSLARRCPPPLSRVCLAAGLLLCTTGSGAAAADDLRYRQDMQDCREGRTSQSRADCEHEARNARAEARRGALGTPVDPASQAQRRCAVFKQEGDHADCLARQGANARVSGSVEGGGVLRELVTPVPVPVR